MKDVIIICGISVLAVIMTVTCYALCVSAGEADKKLEEDLRICGDADEPEIEIIQIEE